MPQLKSFSLIPDVFRAAQLNILDGKFLKINESYLFFFQPETKSKLLKAIFLYKSGISFGSSCKSASIVITTSPLHNLNPAARACDLPKFLRNLIPFILEYFEQIFVIIDQDLSVLPSSIRIIS